MWAVLSDIHANLEALDAVLADIAKHPVTHIFCLGDILGYGPNPIECLERAMTWDATVIGNHDQAAMFDPDGFAVNAGKAIFWHRELLESSGRVEFLEFLGLNPRTLKVEDFLLVHGSPRNPINEYVFPEDIHNPTKLARIGALTERYCLGGHTHVPGVFTEPEAPATRWQYLDPSQCFNFHRLSGRMAIVNVGSVGQPRDNDWRACYALIEGWDITWRRVEYDVDTTVRKIYAIPELDNFLGDRLREGR